MLKKSNFKKCDSRAREYCRNPVIITISLGFSDWSQVFGDASLTVTLLDRLICKTHIIECTWESHRLQEAMKNHKKA
ncbi:MAG: ATP-binding protein [Thermodesulfobacteriota bacterium]